MERLLKLGGFVLLLLGINSVFAEGQAGMVVIIYGFFFSVVFVLTLFFGSFVLAFRKGLGYKSDGVHVFL